MREKTQEIINIDQEKKPKKIDLCKAIYEAMTFDQFSRLERFPTEYFKCKLMAGNTKLMAVKNGWCSENEKHYDPKDRIVEWTNLDDVKSKIMQYCNDTLAHRKHYPDIDVAQNKSIAEYFYTRVKAIDLPPSILWHNQEGLCFSRLPWDLSPESEAKETPAFDEIMSRMTNAEAFMAFVGSLFFNESYGQQYIYLRGPGGDSKGALNRFFQAVFNNSYMAGPDIPKSGKLSDHFTSSLIGKRLMVWADINESDFITRSFFKGITGEDPQVINPKGEAIFTKKLNIKVICMSNYLPDLTSAGSDLRRIIFCEIEKVKGERSKSWEKKLWQEGGDWLHKCIKKYHELCPNHEEIPCDKNDLEEIAENNENDLDELFHKFFVLDSDAKVPIAAVRFATLEMFRNVRDRSQAQSRFCDWMMRSYGITKERKWCIGTNRHCYVGMRFNSDVADHYIGLMKKSKG